MLLLKNAKNSPIVILEFPLFYVIFMSCATSYSDRSHFRIVLNESAYLEIDT